MPPKKATSKKALTKLAAPPADAEVFKNGEKEVAEELATDAKILANGSGLNDLEDAKKPEKSKVTKRGNARGKNAAPELEAEALPSKKPVAKGRAKGKSHENEVIEKETVSVQPESEVVETKANGEVETKLKGKGGGKKAESKTKKATKAKENKKEATSNKNLQEDSNIVEQTLAAENTNTNVSSGKKKKQNKTKVDESMEIKHEIEPESVAESPKKSPRNSKKLEEKAAEIEPQKKKGRTVKKEKPAENDEVVLPASESYENKAEVKENKPTKRGRNNAKTVITTEEIPPINGDTEDVLPKKRSRKAPSVEKQVLKDVTKKGRAKKADKKDDLVEKDVELQEKEAENATNVDVKLEKNEDIEEHPNSNIKEEDEIESAEPAAATAPTTAAAAAKKAKGGRKRAAPSTNKKKTSKTTAENGEKLDDVVDNAELEDEADGSKPSKTKKSKTDSAPLNAITTQYNKADFDLPPPVDGQTCEEPRFNLKISSWNVAGLRSWVKKDGLKFLDYEQPDIFCIQETKCSNDQLPQEVVPIPGYHPYWLCMPGGYAGVAIYSKIMPINVEYGIGNKEFDDCGRIITAEYEKFFLVNVYVPNSGRKLVNLEARMKWEKLFQEFIQNLDARKPVVICGDMNVSHQEIDLANPKSNTRSAGFTKEEREKMTELLALGFIDTFRHLYPERKGAYTYWTYMASARSRNVGWRLDYFIVSERFIKRVVDNCIRSQCMGSDHCPITLFLNL